MISYTKLLIGYLPLYIVLYLLCKSCKISSLLALFILFIFTLPILIYHIFTIYYGIGNNRILNNYNNEKDCKDSNFKNFYSCNVWDSNDNKCYKGIPSSDKNNKYICDTNIVKNIPASIYIITFIIILANISFFFIKPHCNRL